MREEERERIERKHKEGRQNKRGRRSVRGRKETSCTWRQIGKAATVLWILSSVQQVATLKMSGRMFSITLFPLVLSIVIASKLLLLVSVYEDVVTDWSMLIKCKYCITIVC